MAKVTELTVAVDGVHPWNQAFFCANNWILIGCVITGFNVFFLLCTVGLPIFLCTIFSFLNNVSMVAFLRSIHSTYGCQEIILFSFRQV